MLCTFWLGHLLRATTGCNFSSLIWPAGSAPAALARLLFDPLEPQIFGKTQWIATFLPFRTPASSFFPLFLFSLLFFSSLTLLTFAFPSVHIVGSLTSKLPSKIHVYTPELVSWWSFRGCSPRSLIHMLHLKAKAALRQGTPGRMPTEAEQKSFKTWVLDSCDSFDPPNNSLTSNSPVCLM